LRILAHITGTEHWATFGLLAAVVLSFGCVTVPKDSGITPASPALLAAELTGFEKNYAAQEQPLWCWAACAEMIHSYYGTRVPQSEIAGMVKRGDRDAPPTAEQLEAAGKREIMVALNPEMRDEVEEAAMHMLRTGGTFDTGAWLDARIAQFRSSNTDLLVEGLRRREPAVVGALTRDRSGRHALVAFAVEYTEVPEKNWNTSFGNFEATRRSLDELEKTFTGSGPRRYRIRSIRCLDPQDPSQPERVLQGEELGDISLVITRSEAMRLIQEEQRAFRAR
jgi:hypothetical protein